jgi:hypothetical protein
LLIPLSAAAKSEFFVAHMSRQTATALACARALRRSVRDGIFHRHVKRVVVAIRLRVFERTLVFYSRDIVRKVLH